MLLQDLNIRSIFLPFILLNGKLHVTQYSPHVYGSMRSSMQFHTLVIHMLRAEFNETQYSLLLYEKSLGSMCLNILSVCVDQRGTQCKLSFLYFLNIHFMIIEYIAQCGTQYNSIFSPYVYISEEPNVPQYSLHIYGSKGNSM
jgi:hypothetical protein